MSLSRVSRYSHSDISRPKKIYLARHVNGKTGGILVVRFRGVAYPKRLQSTRLEIEFSRARWNIVGQGGHSRVRIPFRQIVCLGTATYYIYRVLLPGSDRARRRSSTRRASRTRVVHGNTSAAKTSDRLLLFVYLKNIFRSVRFDYGSRVILCESARHNAITKIYGTWRWRISIIQRYPDGWEDSIKINQRNSRCERERCHISLACFSKAI